MGQFERKVRKALIDKDMSIRELSKQLGITAAYLYDILRGNRPGTKQKEKIKQILKMED